ncbi:MAG: hypothetical protein O2887_10550 [Bacteroidetes bacterium]|nr:hypothetical protein [Bacteroidota bacterium]MDA1120909.1 hypothetical protein [Bacteroidota bacterium]
MKRIFLLSSLVLLFAITSCYQQQSKQTGASPEAMSNMHPYLTTGYHDIDKALRNASGDIVSNILPLSYGYMLPDPFTINSEKHELHTRVESSIMFASEAYPLINNKIPEGVRANLSGQEPVKLPAWLSDHMLLPIGIPFIMSGMSEPGKVASIRFDNITASALSDENGAWEIEFPYLKPGMNGDLIFTCGGQVKVIKSVATGDTWLCSGQSNMQFNVAKSAESMEATEAVSTLDIRYFDGIGWKLVTGENVKNLSAVAIFFAIEIARRQQGPVGIFVAARGGTSIDAWLPGKAFPDNESGRVKRPLINNPEVLKAAEEDKKDFRPWGQHRLAQWGLSRAVPSSLYEELIKPFGDLPIRGAVWYQGESNAGSVKQAKEYRLWLGNLISEYRRLWGSPALPFVIIQLPVYDPGTPETRKAWAELQNTQASVVRRTKNTELVDIKDLGDLNDIHPARKKEVGERTADKAFKLIDAK